MREESLLRKPSQQVKTGILHLHVSQASAGVREFHLQHDAADSIKAKTQSLDDFISLNFR